MRIISLDITNFRVIKRGRLEFPDKVIGIIGRNGAGKSSIIEAVAWALYGNQAARTGKDEIKATYAGKDENCEVSLTFSINEEKYRVVRRLVGRSERAEVALYRGDSSESVGVTETKNYVGELLGLDWRGFLSSFLARQSELNALSDLQPTKRRDHIAGMLGIERLDKAIQKVKEDVREKANMVAFIERSLQDRKSIETRIAELVESEKSLRAPAAEAADRLTAARTNLERASEGYLASQAKKSEWSQLKIRIEAQQKLLQSSVERRDRLRVELEGLQQNEKNLAGLRPSLDEYPKVRNELDQLAELKGKVGQKEQLSKRQAEIGQELETITRRKSEAAASEKKLIERAKEIPEDIAQRVETAQANVEAAVEAFQALNSEKAALEKDRAKLNTQIGSISELGPESECDRCGRPFGDEYDDIQEHFHKELKALESEIATRTNLLVERQTEGTQLRKTLNDLKVQYQLSQEIGLKLQAASKEMTDLSARLEQLSAQKLQVDEELARFGNVAFDPTRFALLSDRMKELDRIKVQASKLEGSLARLPEVNRQIEEAGGAIESAKKELQSREQELRQLDFSDASHEQLTRLYNEAQNQLEAARQQQATLANQLELVKKELEGKQEQLLGFERQAQELEKFRSEHYYGEKISTLFGEFKKRLIAGIRPRLGEISSGLYSEMTGGKYSMVELDDKYNLQVWDGGAYYGVDRFSGGEKDLANLCLRLAISLALTDAAGLSRSFVILDEVFGSQDDERKELILKSLANLKQRFPQILLVTHIDDIKDGVEEIIEVIPTNAGWSEIRVNGA